MIFFSLREEGLVGLSCGRTWIILSNVFRCPTFPSRSDPPYFKEEAFVSISQFYS